MSFLPVASWLNATYRPPCLDVRSEEEFSRAHLPGAGNVPLGELEGRIHELPRKGSEVFVVGGEDARLAAEALAPRKRWHVVWSDEPPADWPGERLVAGSPEPLWQPNRWLAEHWKKIPRGGRVFDVAMGSGRNAVFLAMRGYRVAGEDILPEAVGFARRLAGRHGVEIEARVGDLRRGGVPAPGAYEGVVVFNYLDRELFGRLETALTPGGVLVYETFTTEQARVGRPRSSRWLLEPMELYGSFPALEILEYREGKVAPERFAASLVARRPDPS